MLVALGSPLHGILQGSHFTVRPSIRLAEPEGGTFLELDDRCVEFDVSNSIDDQCGRATVRFAVGKLGFGNASLNPLSIPVQVGFGGRPALDPNIQITIGAYIGNGAGFEALLQFFSGRIDRVNIAAAPGIAQVECRDDASRYINRFVEQAAFYGSETGVAIETVMGQVLTDNGFSPASLSVPLSPGYVLSPGGMFGEVSVLEVLRILAQHIGWDVRHFQSHTTDLTFYDPGRTRLGYDDALTGDRVERITELAWGDEDVRNAVSVWYPDAEFPVEVEDTASIERYGRRWAGIHEDRTRGILDAITAGRLAEAALADMKDPFASHAAQLPFYPIPELNDRVQFSGTGYYTVAQEFAVVGYRHQWKAAQSEQDKGFARTILACRGRSAGAYREYRKSVPPRVILSGNPPPANRWAPEGTRWVQKSGWQPYNGPLVP